ncbi:hypothetical protein [Candidatus Magnetominusculus dajiuhuensis]|uniref:hypothetical protein n=1 Tax=Candidatus Magnetominusculus dajiuhuensis TaxID=3137712 RepID=UPI003B436843
MKKILIETAVAVLMLTLLTSCFNKGGGSSGGGSGSGTGGVIPVTSGTVSTVTATAGNSHNQAKDCLLCHNTGLQSSESLVIGGTMYVASSVTNVNDLNYAYVDDLTTAGNGIIRIQFIDNNTNVAVDSIYYTDTSSKGYNAKGNLFILGRMMSSGLLGSYYIRLLDSNGSLIAQSDRVHRFSSAYNSSYPNDPNNMYSCNACHMLVPSGGAPGLLYPNMAHYQGKDCLQCHNAATSARSIGIVPGHAVTAPRPNTTPAPWSATGMFPPPVHSGVVMHSIADSSSTRALTVGGTLYLSATDSNNVCVSSLRLQLLDDNSTAVYDTATYTNAGISGNYGKGNFAIMLLSLASLKGSYFTRILAPDGTILAASALKHDFTTSYSSGTPTDLLNRYSCNACHNTTPQNSAPGLLYPNVNSAKCQ